MQTTSIFIEHIIIGAGVMTWLLPIIIFIDDRVINLFKSSFSIAPIFVILIGFCYVIGLIFDLLFDWIMDTILCKQERMIKRKYEIPDGHVSHVLQENAEDYYDFYMSRKRIIRSTCFNMILIGGTWFLLFFIRYRLSILAAFILFFCLILSALSFIFYWKTLVYYYYILKMYLDANERKYK